MKRKTVRQKVWSFIEQSSDPALLTSEFLQFGSRSQINRVLNQLIDENLIKRAGYGVYVRAKRFVIPKTQEVVYIAMYGVDAVAKKHAFKKRY